jgi:integrase
MRDHRVFKIVKALGKQAGLAQLHPHAFRRRTRGNLRAVQEHLRHSDIQTTTLYTRLTKDDLQRVVSVFARSGEQKKDSRPFTAGLELEGNDTLRISGW